MCVLRDVLSWLPSLSSFHACKEKGRMRTHPGVRHPQLQGEILKDRWLRRPRQVFPQHLSFPWSQRGGGGGSLTPPHSVGRGSPHRLGDLQPQGWRSRQRQSPKERPLQPAPWLVCALLTPLFLPHSMLRHLLPSRSTPATHLLFPKIFLMCSMISLLLLVSTSTRTCSPESGNGKQRGQSAKDRAARSSASSRRGDGSAFSGEAL